MTETQRWRERGREWEERKEIFYESAKKVFWYKKFKVV
jgi:hypothetical protein